MLKTINWGIIGCGDVTEVKSGPAFNKVAGSRLHAVMRRDAVKAADYAKRHNVPKWYSDAYALIADPDVNAIYVATPPSSHEEYAIAAMEAGKPVYLEKPMTVSAASAKRIAAKAEALSVALTVAHYRRELPLFKKIKELLDANHIGEIRYVNVELFQPVNAKGFEPRADYWRLDPAVSGGGLFHDLSPHQLDLMLYFFGRPVFISGTSTNQAHLYPADDMVAGIIRFESGTLMNGAWCFTAPPDAARDRCTIIGSEGMMEFSIFTMLRLSISKNGRTDEIRFDAVPHVQQPMIEKVAAYFRGESANPCPPADGVTVMEMIDKFTISA
jgi:predicted dehydrogenase